MFRLFKKNIKKNSSINYVDKEPFLLENKIKLDLLNEFQFWEDVSVNVKDIKLPIVEDEVTIINENLEPEICKLNIVDLFIINQAELRYDITKNEFLVQNDYSKEFIDIESSIINKFILLNDGYFIPNESKSFFLNGEELNKKFIWHEKNTATNYSKRNEIILSAKFDFISLDKKIVSIKNRVYYLDWDQGFYFGYDSSIEMFFNWDWKKVSYTMYSINPCRSSDNILFLYPSKFDNSRYDDYNDFKIITDGSTRFYPLSWINDNHFISLINKIIDFNFPRELYDKSELFLKNKYYNEQKSIQESKLLSSNFKLEVILEFDSDRNGIVDIIEIKGFNELLMTCKEEIQTKGDEYVKNFIKLNKYIDRKKNNIQKIYELLLNSELYKDTEFYYGTLKNEIILYNKFNFHSMAMITFLLENNKFNFYEIYETFDELDVFNSNWENEISSKINTLNEMLNRIDLNIESKFDELISTVYETGSKINTTLDKLTYQNEKSINKLTNTIDKRLENINSSINTNNLLTLINTYQTYKVNLNTKKLKK